jgi:hypothetical protein
MGAVTEFARDAHSSACAKADEVDLSFLPKNLIGQCRSLIESYHEVHGFACLPDILWKSRLGPFIEKQPELRQFLRKASTTRSAKKANEGFVGIATVILSLEILASSFAGWSAIYPVPGEMARAILKRNARTAHMPLMEFYLYPPKYISTAAIATLAPPAAGPTGEAQFYRASRPELSGEKLALGVVNSTRDTLDAPVLRAAAASTG